MILDSEEQRQILLEMIARAHRSPSEVAAVERLRGEVADARIAESAAPHTPVSTSREG